jgi:hypothetical protein
MINYCRAWVPHFELHTGLLSNLIYGKAMTAKDKIVWTKEAEKQFVAIKQLLISDSVLAFPRYDCELTQTVDCREGSMTSVLTPVSRWPIIPPVLMRWHKQCPCVCSQWWLHHGLWRILPV